MSSRTDRPSAPLLTRLRDRAAGVRRAVLRRRRTLAAVLTAAAVAAGVHAAAPPAPDTTTVLVATRDLPPGAVVTAADLRPVELPPEAVPDGVLARPAGARLAGALGAGEPVTATRVVGPDLTTATTGTVALPVRLSDAAMAELLDVGDRIDLWATDPQAGTTALVAEDVAVLALPRTESAGAGPDGGQTGRLAVLAIVRADVHEVTAVSVTSYVTFSWPER